MTETESETERWRQGGECRRVLIDVSLKTALLKKVPWNDEQQQWSPFGKRKSPACRLPECPDFRRFTD